MDRGGVGGETGDSRVNISKRKMSSALSLESETEMKITFLLFKCAAAGGDGVGIARDWSAVFTELPTKT